MTLWKLILLSLCLYESGHAAESMVAPDTIAARARGCSTCHGTQGQGTADLNFPRIAGKPAGYLTHQLLNFRDGRRSYPPMNYLLAYLHDDYLQELAEYFAAQPAQAAQPVQAAQLVHNEKTIDAAAKVGTEGGVLARHGDPTRGIPACVQCHGPRLTGLEPAIPGLIGLNSRYIAAQLVSWRVGTRHANAPDCMALIAARLTDTQIRQVSGWLAAQAFDPSSAAPAGSWKTPIACGSEP